MLVNATMLDLARNVARIRKSRGLTQIDLMRITGCTSVAMIESGKRRSPREHTLKAIAKGLRCTVSDLFTESKRLKSK